MFKPTNNLFKNRTQTKITSLSEYDSNLSSDEKTIG